MTKAIVLVLIIPMSACDFGWGCDADYNPAIYVFPVDSVTDARITAPELFATAVDGSFADTAMNGESSGLLPAISHGAEIMSSLQEAIAGPSIQ